MKNWETKCKVDGCDRNSNYAEKNVCQKHYFRFMRNGHYGLKETRAEIVRHREYRTQNPAGYYLIYEPQHPLSQKQGNVYEHRAVYYAEISETVESCDLCGDKVTWDTCHIDHIDESVTNNKKKNLRCLCRSCNVFRGHTAFSMGKYFLTINGISKTANAWARADGVEVSITTILRRKRNGMSDYDAVYGKRLTHQNTKTKKYVARYDEVRGIHE